MSDSPNRNDSEARTLGKVFIGGLSWGSTSETLKEYFSSYGEIIDAIIMLDKISMRSRGFGFVTFSDPAAVEAVVSESHVIDGRPVEVKRAVSKEEMENSYSGNNNDTGNSPAPARTKKIFVGGLAHTTTDEQFKKYFEQLGTIVESQVMVDHDTGRHRGFGFVTFDNEDIVDKIMEASHEIDGKQVEIKRAEPKRPVKVGRSHLQPMSPYSSMGGGRGGMGRNWGRVGGSVGGGFAYGGGVSRGGYGGGGRTGYGGGGPGYGGGNGGGGGYGGGAGSGYGGANNNMENSNIDPNLYFEGYGMGGGIGGNWGMDQSMYASGMGMMGGGPGYSGYGTPAYGPSATGGAAGGNGYGAYNNANGGGDNSGGYARTFQRSGRAYHPYKNQPQ